MIIYIMFLSLINYNIKNSRQLFLIIEMNFLQREYISVILSTFYLLPLFIVIFSNIIYTYIPLHSNQLSYAIFPPLK
jgi:hypothetical protein